MPNAVEKTVLNFTANGQQLTKTSGIKRYASDTVNYIEAIFDLSEEWNEYDYVKAVWCNETMTDAIVINTILGLNGYCIVPQEVLTREGSVKVNLVASIVSNNAITDRLTSHSVTALTVNEKVKLDGTETSEITPSQFEQFVEVIHQDAVIAEDSAIAAKAYSEAAEESRDSAALSADTASQAASDALGYKNIAVEAAANASRDALSAHESAVSASDDAYSANNSAVNALASANTATDAAQSASGSAASASASAASAAEDASKAEIASAKAGYMFFHISELGHLIYERTSNTEVGFYLRDGHLFVEAIA